jgi:hypothetical protein
MYGLVDWAISRRQPKWPVPRNFSASIVRQVPRKQVRRGAADHTDVVVLDDAALVSRRRDSWPRALRRPSSGLIVLKISRPAQGPLWDYLIQHHAGAA